MVCGWFGLHGLCDVARRGSPERGSSQFHGTALGAEGASGHVGTLDVMWTGANILLSCAIVSGVLQWSSVSGWHFFARGHLDGAYHLPLLFPVSPVLRVSGWPGMRLPFRL